MKILNIEEIEKFVKKRADSRGAFERWRRMTEVANWKSFEDVKRDFPAADRYKSCVIFDIGGNKYRLIAKIDYREDIQVVRVRKAMTHAEYSRDKWKTDCEQA
jgi:mRNA interferase HigB